MNKYGIALLSMMLLVPAVEAKNAYRFNPTKMRKSNITILLCAGLSGLLSLGMYNEQVFDNHDTLKKQSVIVPLATLIGGSCGLIYSLAYSIPDCYELVDEEGNVVEPKEGKVGNDTSSVKSKK
jgi:hypothetical protein